MGDKYVGVKAASKTTIEITFQYGGRRCRERLRLEPTPANMKRAERHRAAIIDAIEIGTFDYAVTFPNSPRVRIMAKTPGDGITIKEFINKWIKDQKNHFKMSTYFSYLGIVSNVIEPVFGHLQLSELKRRHIKDWGKKQTCSNKRIANILTVLRTALADAVEDELIDTNILYGWKYKRREEPREDHVEPFSREEQAAILEQLKDQEKNLIQFAFWTGQRTSELMALQWGDIDWINGEVKVRRARTRYAKEAEAPKTKAGRRNVKLLQPAIMALKAQKPWTFLADEHIFHNPRTNQPWASDQKIRTLLWTPALKRAGVAYRNPYQTRHTFASMMLSSGEHPMWVAKQMGHADWTMIARTYGKWLSDADPECGNRAIELFADEAEMSRQKIDDTLSNRRDAI